MDLRDRAGALARPEERILLGSIGGPAEAALALGVLMTHIFRCTGHLDELLELLLVCIGEDAVRAVTLLFLGFIIDVHGLLGISDLLHSELYPSNFQDVALLYFIVLNSSSQPQIKYIRRRYLRFSHY